MCARLPGISMLGRSCFRMFIWGTGVRQMSPSKNISSQNDRFEWKETAQALYRSYVKHAYLCPGGIARVDWEFSHVNLLRQSGLSHRAPLQVAHHCGIGSLRACPAALCGHVVWTGGAVCGWPLIMVSSLTCPGEMAFFSYLLISCNGTARCSSCIRRSLHDGS